MNLEVRVKTISWATACHLGRWAVGHRHSNHRAGVHWWKPRGQTLPLHPAGPCETTYETKTYKLYISTRALKKNVVKNVVKTLEPVSCEHDVVFMKLLPAVVLSRASLVIAVPAPGLLSTNGGVESTATV